MPPIGIALGRTDFTALKVVLSPAETDLAGKVLKPEAAIRYGLFVNNLINFLIIAFCVFLMVKAINRIKRDTPPPPPGPPAPPAEDVVLLREIRDALVRK